MYKCDEYIILLPFDNAIENYYWLKAHGVCRCIKSDYIFSIVTQIDYSRDKLNVDKANVYHDALEYVNKVLKCDLEDQYEGYTFSKYIISSGRIDKTVIDEDIFNLLLGQVMSDICAGV